METTTTTEMLTRPEGVTDEVWQTLRDSWILPPASLANKTTKAYLELHQAKATEKESYERRLNSMQAMATKRYTQLLKVGKLLKEEAEERSWCDDYDEFVDRVNEALGEDVLERMRSTYNVVFTVTLTVETSDEDTAHEIAESALRNQDTSDVQEVDWYHDSTERA